MTGRLTAATVNGAEDGKTAVMALGSVLGSHNAVERLLIQLERYLHTVSDEYVHEAALHIFGELRIIDTSGSLQLREERGNIVSPAAYGEVSAWIARASVWQLTFRISQGRQPLPRP
jgi:hypothetical protein